jgi:hypothetical protein
MSEALKLASKRDVMLQTTRINLQESVRNYWVATVEPHITREDLLEPSFWSNIALSFRQFDRVEVRQDDGKFFAEYLVLHADKTAAYLKELNWVDLEKKVKTQNPDFQYKYRGPHAKHSIVRVKDGSVLIEYLETKAEAERWLTEYLDKI